jgi:predicted nucleic acid-binding protein
MNERLYLDNCTFNRPFDDQTQMKIRLETEAKLYIQSSIREKRYTLVWSYMLDAENDENPYDEKRKSISPWKEIADCYCASSDDILLAGNEIMKKGIQAKDALHIACAIKCKCGYFITTDKKLTNKTIEGIRILNPTDFVTKTERI